MKQLLAILFLFSFITAKSSSDYKLLKKQFIVKAKIFLYFSPTKNLKEPLKIFSILTVVTEIKNILPTLTGLNYKQTGYAPVPKSKPPPRPP